MATTTSGFRYPVSADDPDIPRDIRQLAEDIDYFNRVHEVVGIVSASDSHNNEFVEGLGYMLHEHKENANTQKMVNLM